MIRGSAPAWVYLFRTQQLLVQFLPMIYLSSHMGVEQINGSLRAWTCIGVRVPTKPNTGKRLGGCQLLSLLTSFSGNISSHGKKLEMPRDAVSDVGALHCLPQRVIAYSLAILATRKLKDCEPGWPGNQVSCGHSRKSPRHIFSSCTVFIQAIQFSHSWCPFERTIGFLGPRCARNAKSICSGCLCHTVHYLNLQGLGCWCRVRNQSISGMRWALEALLQERCWIHINKLSLLTESMIK